MVINPFRTQIITLHSNTQASSQALQKLLLFTNWVRIIPLVLHARQNNLAFLLTLEFASATIKHMPMNCSFLQVSSFSKIVLDSCQIMVHVVKLELITRLQHILGYRQNKDLGGKHYPYAHASNKNSNNKKTNTKFTQVTPHKQNLHVRSYPQEI